MTQHEGMTAGEAARRLGIAVTTLRTWHQRYGLGPSTHEPRLHRRYREEDLVRLDLMRRLTSQGVPAAEAARVALAQPNALPTPARAGGGHAIPVGRSGTAARGLATAAMRLDAVSLVDIMTTSVLDHGVAHTWEQLLCPVLVGIGERHAATGQIVEVEHLLSQTITRVLATTVSQHQTGGRTPPQVLLACADEEQHSLPIEALAAALAEAGRPARLLGARVPPAALAAAVRRTKPSAVLVWSHAAQTAQPDQVLSLLTRRPRPTLVAAAGPGWNGVDLPAGVHRPASLTEALILLDGLPTPI